VVPGAHDVGLDLLELLLEALFIFFILLDEFDDLLLLLLELVQVSLVLGFDSVVGDRLHSGGELL
jgi:hypothetical protein